MDRVEKGFRTQKNNASICQCAVWIKYGIDLMLHIHGQQQWMFSEGQMFTNLTLQNQQKGKCQGEHKETSAEEKTASLQKSILIGGRGGGERKKLKKVTEGRCLSTFMDDRLSNIFTVQRQSTC